MLRLRRVPLSTRIDLQTVRETLCYMRDDVGSEPGLSRVASALDKAIQEIDASASPKQPHGSTKTPLEARFFASRS